MKARLITLLAIAAAGLALAGVAQAHVTVHPNALPSGGFTVVNVQVPSEDAKASTVKVDVKIPPGVFFLSTAPIPGWSAKVYFTRLAKPVKVFDDTSTQQVSRVVWTANGGKLGPGQFLSFPMSMLVPKAKAGTILTFKALQTYSNGKIVRWIGPETADAPAPQVIVTAAGSPVQDYPAGVSAAKMKMSKGIIFALPVALLGGARHRDRATHVVTLRSVAAATLVAAVLAPAAAAHGGGGGRLGYHSTVIRLTPANPAVHVQVVDSDDRLQVHVDGNTTLIVDGYEKEPYLRFDPSGVFRNTLSPATYLNDDRYGSVELPADANPKAAPVWVKVAPAGRLYEWHDHRIHWMSTTYPPVVAADKSIPHHIFNWTVPGTVDGKRLQIKGSLDYKPLPSQKFPVVLVVPLILVAVGGVALVYLRNRRTPNSM